MSLNTVKYKGELLAEDERISTDTPGVLGEYKELRADALEADTLDITVLSESGTIRNFKKNDKVEYFRSGSRVGVYYLQSVTRVGPKLYTLSALSAVGLLIVRPHRGGIYTGQTVAKVVSEICGDIPVLIETVYRGIKLYGWLPIASARDSLVQVLFAIGAWLHTDENGTLRVQKLWDGTASIIGPGSVHAANIQVKYLDPVSSVAVTEHQYIAGTEDVTLFEGTAQQGDVIEFDEPAHSLTAEGFTVLESGANYAVLSAGTGKLTGKSYVHNRRVVTRTVTKGAAENVEEIADATLVSLVNSSAVAQRMAAYYACREQLTVDVNPAAEHAGHVVSLWNEWDKQQTLACIASRETKISGLLKSRTSALVGFLPPQPESSEYFDERVLLTGSGTWTVPEGVTTYTKVLIGGGQGGKHGGKGEDGKQRTSSWTERVLGTLTYNWSGYLPGAISKGGVGGEGGVGGKVLVETVNDATPGESIAYSCGAAGAGATTDGAEGENGTATTMGGSSSDSGSSSNIGYTDPVTGEVFAAKGDTGIAGGDSGGCSDVSAYPNPTVSGCLYVGQGIAEATDVVDEDGKVWKSGAWLLYNNTQQIYGTGNSASADGDLSHGAVECSASCSGPSGAAVGANGSDGSATNCKATAGKEGNPTYMYAYASPGYPVNGANAATAPKKPSAYGKGGRGGHGGGAGGCGGYSATGKTTSSTMTQKTQANTRGVGTGGLGSVGGEAGDGCIIIYYRKKKELQSGPLVTSNNLGLLDSLGRRMIV
nr:MAG TPA: hypothetical protein [Caudoviricetes sp.]